MARQYYIISLSEDYTYQRKNKVDSLKYREERQLIFSEFRSLIEFVPEKYQFLSIVMTSFLSITDVIDSNQMELIQTDLKNFYKSVVDKLIQEKRFDTAVYVAENYTKLMKDDSLKKKAEIARHNNFEQMKYTITPTNAKEILNKIENTHLNELAIKKLSKSGNLDEALDILQRKFIINQTFRYKAYLHLYYEIGEDEKYKKLKDLILNNNTFPESLRKSIKEHK